MNYAVGRSNLVAHWQKGSGLSLFLFSIRLRQAGHADVWASTRPALMEFSKKMSGSRVLEGCFGANFTAMVVPKDQPGRLAYVSEFVEQAKSSGLIERAVMNSGWRGVRVAPSENLYARKR